MHSTFGALVFSACLAYAGQGRRLHKTTHRSLERWHGQRRLDSQETQSPDDLSHSQSYRSRGGASGSCEALARLLLEFNPAAAWQVINSGLSHRLPSRSHNADKSGLSHRLPSRSHNGERFRILTMQQSYDMENDTMMIDPNTMEPSSNPSGDISRDDQHDEWLKLMMAADNTPSKTLNNTGMVAHSPRVKKFGAFRPQGLNDFNDRLKSGYSFYVANVEVCHGYQTEEGNATTEFTTSHRLTFTWPLLRAIAAYRRAPWNQIDKIVMAREVFQFLIDRTDIDFCDPDWELDKEGVPFTTEYMTGRELFEWYPDLFKYISDKLLAPDWPRVRPIPNFDQAIQNYRDWYAIPEEEEVEVWQVNMSKADLWWWASVDQLVPDEPLLRDDYDSRDCWGRDQYMAGALGYTGITQVLIEGDLAGIWLDKEAGGQWWDGKFK